MDGGKSTSESADDVLAYPPDGVELYVICSDVFAYDAVIFGRQEYCDDCVFDYFTYNKEQNEEYHAGH